MYPGTTGISLGVGKGVPRSMLSLRMSIDQAGKAEHECLFILLYLVVDVNAHTLFGVNQGLNTSFSGRNAQEGKLTV